MRILSTLVIGVFVLTFWCGRSYADSQFTSTDSGNTVTVSATSGNSSNSSGTTGSTSSGQNPCTWQKAPSVLLQEAGLTAKNANGYWELVTCPSPSELPSPGQNVVWSAITLMPIAFVWVNISTPTPTVPQSLIQQAEDSIQLPNPMPEMTPDPGVVNLNESLSINGDILHNYVASAAAGNVTVVATAEPYLITWQTGDGGSVNCPANSQVNCSYTYLQSSINQPYIWDSEPSYKVTATVEWTVNWYSTGISESGNLQPLYTQGTMYLPVIQIESVLNTP